MRKVIVLLLLAPTLGMAQAIVSTGAGGAWDQTTTWVGGVVPDASNSSSITIIGPVNVSSSVYNSTTPLIIDQTTVTTNITSGTLTIDAGAQVNVANAATDLGVAGSGQIQVNGKLVQLAGATFTGTTAGNTFFNSGSTYEHRNTTWGTLLTASWNAASTILVTGLTGSGNAGVSWAQSIGNFTFACPSLGAGATANLAGRIITFSGNLNVNQTGASSGLFQLSSNQTVNISVTGDFNVSNNSAILVTTSGTVGVTIGGTFNFASTSATASRNATTGTGTIQLNGGDFLVQSGTWNFVSGAGTGTIILNGGNYLASPGSFVTRTGSGNANINFIGAVANQGIDLDPALITSGAINLTVGKSSGNVNMQSPLTINSFTQSGGSLIQNANTLTINGIINQTGGNIDASSNTTFIVGGAGTISAGLVFSPSPSLFDTFTMNRSGVTLSTSSDFQITNLNLTAGTLTHSGSLTIEDQGLITVTAGVLTNVPLAAGVYDLSYPNGGNLNTGNELPTAPSAVVHNFTKSAAGTLTLTKNIEINGDLTLSGGTFANGANSILLNGNFISNGASSTAVGATFTFSSATATLTGSTAPSFRNLVVNGSLTPSVGYGVTADYTVGPGATVNAGSGTVTFAGTTVITNGGTINLNGVTISGTFSMTAPSNTLGIAGDFSSAGTFNNGGGTVLFNGTSNLTGTAEAFNNVQVTGTVTSTGNVAQLIAGSLVNNGSFSIGTGTLTWSGSGSLSGSGNTTVGDLNVSGVSFTSTSSGNLTLNDDLLGSGTFDSSGSAGTVIFAGAGSAINKTGTTTFRSISVSGTLTPATVYTLAGAGGIAVSGTLVSGSTVIFGGTTQTITGAGTIAFNTFTTNLGSTLTITPNITINANLAGAGSITSNGTITFVGLTMSGTGTKNFTNVTVGAGTLTTDANYSIAGNLVVTGTLAAGIGNATFNGTTTVSGAGAATFNNVDIIGTFTARLSSEPVLTINGTFTNGGTFNGSSGTVSLGGNFINNGTFSAGTGTFTFNTTNSATRTITGSTSVTFNNLTIFDKGQAIDVSNNMVSPVFIGIAGTLTFGEANAVFDADGSGSAVLRILSTNDSPATDGRIGAITFANSNFGTSNITVERFVSNEGTGRFYRYIASPVVGASVAQLKAVIPVTGTFTDPSDGASTPPCTGCISTSPSLFSFNELAAQAYDAFPASGLASASSFTNGRGYSAFFRHTGSGGVGSVTLTFTGTNPSTAAISLPVSSIASGYSLVGNPYPSPIVWGATGWARTNIGDVIIVRNNANGVHESHGTADNFIIASGQSFWVQSTLGGASLQISETAKSSSGTYQFYRTEETIVDELELQLTKSTTGTTDDARIVLTQGSLLSSESFDGPKFNNSIDNGDGTTTQVQDISVLSNDSKALDINAIPSVACGQQFNIKITDFVNSGETIVDYILKVNPSGSLKGISWVLHDNYTGLDVDATSNPTYNFVVDNSISASKSSSRFILKAASALAIDPGKSLSTSTSLCSGSEVAITVASQNGFTYGAEINGIYYPNLAQGDGSNLSVFIDNDKLSDGGNTIRLKANSGCDQQFLSTTLMVNKESAYQVNTTTTMATLCGSGSVKLEASSLQNDAQLKWYQTETSSVVLATGTDFNTPILTDSAIYYVAAVSPTGCEGARVPVNVAFEDISSTLSVVPNVPVCRGETLILSAASSLSGGSYKWYDAIDAATPVGTDSELSINLLKSTKNYYVSYVSAGGCESDRIAVAASIIPYAPVITAQTQSLMICSGGTHQLIASDAPAESVYQWFDNSDAGTLLAEGSTFTTDVLSASTTYYVGVKSPAGCVSPRVAVSAKVADLPSIPNFGSPSYGQICNNGETILTITNPETTVATYKWYTSASEQISIQEGLQLKTETLSQKTSYFVSAVNANGCESKQRKEVVVNVNQFTEPKIDGSMAGQLKSNYATGNQWYLDNELLPAETGQIHFLSSGTSGVYDLKVTTEQGCSDWAGSIHVTSLVTGLEDIPKEVKLYPNPVSEILKVYIEGNDKVQVNMLDERGAKVSDVILRKNVKGWEGELDVHMFSKGLYFISIFSETKSITHKVIIK